MSRTVTQTIGDAQVSIITDGATTFTPDLFPETDAAHIGALLAEAGVAQIETNFNATLIRMGGRTILADAGPRDLFGPTCGHLAEGLAELDVTPEDVDTLMVTHLHPDHVAGMITKDGAAVFPNAALHVTDADRAFWSNDAHFQGALSGSADWARLAQAVLAAYDDRLVIARDGSEVAPGLTFMDLPGHTPGHAGWRLESAGEMLIHAGDTVHAPALQLADPDVAIAFDIDMNTARDTRRQLLEEIYADRALFTGGHFLSPAFNRVRREGLGFKLVPGVG